MNPSSNLFLIGPMGAGKTKLGRRIAAHFRLAFVDMDVELERRTGVSVNLIFEVEGEPGFRQRESQLLAETAANVAQVIATGGGVVLAARNRAILSERGFVLYLPASVDAQLARLARDTRRPLLRAPDRLERLNAMAALRNPLYESTADLILTPQSGSVSRAADRAIHALEQTWQRPARAA